MEVLTCSKVSGGRVRSDTYQAIAVEILPVGGRSALLVGAPHMNTRTAALSNLLQQSEQVLESAFRFCTLKEGDAVTRISEYGLAKGDSSYYEESDDFQMIDTPVGSVASDVMSEDLSTRLKSVTMETERQDFPPGSGDEWAYWAAAHLKSKQAIASLPNVKHKTLIASRGCPLGTDDEWMYWWSRSPDAKNESEVTSSKLKRKTTPDEKSSATGNAPLNRSFPPGTGDEWAYWAHIGQVAVDRGSPDDFNDEWAYWASKRLEETTVKSCQANTKPKLPTSEDANRQCPLGTNDEWAYWVWRHNEGKQSKDVAVVEKDKSPKQPKDFPPGSGDMWAHFAALHKSREEARKVQDDRVTLGNVDCTKWTKSTASDVKSFKNVNKPQTGGSAYAVWLNGLNK